MSKTLVAYFSATGTTRRVAERLARAAQADLFEIKPAVPYSSADLDWTNKASRTSKERSDESIRPALAVKLADASAYNVVYIGFPIWWYVAPRVIATFDVLGEQRFLRKDDRAVCHFRRQQHGADDRGAQAHLPHRPLSERSGTERLIR